MAINYKSYEFQMYEYVCRMEQLLSGKSGAEAEEWRKKLLLLKHNLQTRRFRVAVVGAFNRGKTSFVNALLGKNVLPADFVPTTAAINRITYSDRQSAYIVFKNGQKKPVEIEELADYITKLSGEAQERALQIEEAVVEYPSLFCRNGVDLIDTPGMNDEDAMNQVTVSKLEDIDLAIVAVDASLPFDMTECAFTVQLLESPQICQIIVVLTKIDMIRERERQKIITYIEERIREGVRERLEQRHEPGSEMMQKYEEIFGNLHVFAVSSLDALDALSCNDMELFEKSGFLRLNNELPEIILSSQNSGVVLNTGRELVKIIRRCREWLAQGQSRRQNSVPQMDAAKKEFAQTMYLNTINAYTLTEKEMLRFLPEIEDEVALIRRSFAQALGRMRALNQQELVQTLTPVVKEMFQSLNVRYHEKEERWFQSYYSQNVLRPIEQRLNGERAKQRSAFPALGQIFETQYDRMLACLREKVVEGGVPFYWVRYPIPKVRGNDWNVISYMEQAVRDSLQDYRKRAAQKMSERFANAQKLLNERAQAVVMTYFDRVETMKREMRQQPADRGGQEELQKLEQCCAQLKERFLAEIG